MSNERFNDILDFSLGYDRMLAYPETVDFQTVARETALNETWRDTTSQTMWDILGACGKDINNVVCSSAIDYVQNISDINTAQIPALLNMAGMLNYETGSLLDLYQIMPVGLQVMVNLLSVDREYLFGGESPILSVPMVRKLMERMKVELMRLTDKTPNEQMALEDVFTEVKRNNHRVNAKQYREIIKSIFYEFIVDVLSARYSTTEPGTLIDNLLYDELSKYMTYDSVPTTTILDKMIKGESRHPLDLETTHGTAITIDPSIDTPSTASEDTLYGQIEAMRRDLNVSISFDPWATAETIVNNGLSPINELTENEKTLVETIINAHGKEMFNYATGEYRLGVLDTRYAYYREQEFVKYLNAFMVLYSLNVQTVTLSTTTLNLIKVDKISQNEAHVLDFFNYVNKEWIYSETPKKGEIDQYGVGRPLLETPIATMDCTPKFIPRLGLMSGQVLETQGYSFIIEHDGMSRMVPLDTRKPENIIEAVAQKLTDLVMSVHFMRNEMKRQAQFNAMRGTGSLLAHAINDFLLTKYPVTQFSVIPRWSDEPDYSKALEEASGEGIQALSELKQKIQENIKLFRNFTNVDIIEYMDTTEYFNIHPTGIFTNDENVLKSRYWEQLKTAITNRDEPQLGVFSPNEIHDFYRNSLSMGALHSSTEVEDDIEEFLISLYESGATDTYFDTEKNQFVHAINDVSNEDTLFMYDSKTDRIKVQENGSLVAKQDKQFLRYSSDTAMTGENRNRNGSGQVIESFNWKNKHYASTMLHPFLYTFQLWDPLVNIIINAMSEYVTSDLEGSITRKKIFDELYGKLGEGLNFWKYNILDFTGYVTRYEYEKHSLTDASGETSPLTGYDGMFYPSAVQQFIEAYERSKKDKEEFEEGSVIPTRTIDDTFVPLVQDADDGKMKSIFITLIDEDRQLDQYEKMASPNKDHPETFEQVIASIYWQIEFFGIPEGYNKVSIRNNLGYQTFYGKWICHLGYPKERLRRLAKQLWYWRDRIVDAATHRYEVCNYNLDLGNNSMFLLDTFHDEEKEVELPYIISALDSSIAATNDVINQKININHNTTAGRCHTPNVRPKELWIRWNAEPIALPALDLWWDNDNLPEREFKETMPETSRLGHDAKNEEFGQIRYKNNTTNDVISDVVERFKTTYTIDEFGTDQAKGNKVPVFYSFQQNADVLVFAAWNKDPDDGTILADYDRTHLCPLHILCKEVQSEDGEYLFERLLDDRSSYDPMGETVDESFLSAPYIFCGKRGSLLIPMYRVYAPKHTQAPDPRVASFEENAYVLAGQTVFVKLVEIICQTMVGTNYETTEKFLTYEEKPVFINAESLFAGTVLISNGTSVVFSCDSDKLGFAFLGNLTSFSRDVVSKTLATGCTRYLADSDPVEKIALLRKLFYKVYSEIDPKYKKPIDTYADLRIADAETDFQLWNSFDRNDKFLCVVQYEKALNVGTWRLEPKGDMALFSSRLLNLVSDASYIPEFAYQSPKNFNRFPEISGMNKLYLSSYFNHKNHWAIQLLGLENKLMLEFVKVAKDLIVHDETDNVDTYVNPGQVVDAIYRIWEESDLTEQNMGIERLHNPRLHLAGGEAVWKECWAVDEAGKESFLNRYLSIVRCNDRKDGEILNEKNWVFKTMRIRDIVEDIAKQDAEGYRKLPLDEFYTEALSNGGKTRESTSHILVGTQDPYKYAPDPDWPTTLKTPAYLLQYGNGIAGVRALKLRVIIRQRTEDDFPTELTWDFPTMEKAPYVVEVDVKFFKKDPAKGDEEEDPDKKTPIDVYMDTVNIIPAKSLLMAVSEDEVDHLADYHMLVHHDDVFYNIPYPDEDDVLRTEFDPRIDDEENPPPKNPPRSFLDYLYIYEGSAAFKINEQSDKFCTFDWERPVPELDKLLYNFRKNQVDLNCLLPWSTYVTQEHNPTTPHIDSVALQTTNGTDFRGREEMSTIENGINALLVDSSKPLPPVWEQRMQLGYNDDDVVKKLYEAGYRIHSWENSEDTRIGGQIDTIDVSGEDFDPIYRIYANYQRVEDDSERGYHFDLFFNIQNLFKPPFEYISSVTNQPAPLLPPESYLYLPGDEESQLNCNKGRLTLYAQMKWLVNDLMTNEKLIPLVTYEIANISDDKPKFFMKRVGEAENNLPAPPKIHLVFEDVWVDASEAKFNSNYVLTEDLHVVQCLAVNYNNVTTSDNNRLKRLSFSIVQNEINGMDGGANQNPYIDIKRTKEFYRLSENDGDRPYPCRFNPNYTELSDNDGLSWQVRYTYQDSGYTNEDLYLCWTIPKGTNLVNAVNKMGCLVQDTAMKCKATMFSSQEAEVIPNIGHIYINPLTGPKKYIGVEHGKHLNKYGYVMVPLSSAIRRRLRVQ